MMCVVEPYALRRFGGGAARLNPRKPHCAAHKETPFLGNRHGLGVSDAWMQKVLEQRAAKDHHFAHDPQSPVHGQEFQGLAYFAPDVGHRLLVRLVAEEPQILAMPRTGGDEVEYTRVGHFAFDTPDGPAKLAAFASPDYGQKLFVPFRDKTNTVDTYGAGRYLEARPLSDGRYLLDFNLAYHPYCAYNEAFTCPMVPIENWLQVRIEAGERLASWIAH